MSDSAKPKSKASKPRARAVQQHIPKPPNLAVPVVPPPDLRPVRTGLHLVLAAGVEASIHAPQLISHRRSGTHLLGTILERHWSLPGWLKSHDFPERRSLGRKAVYVVRNPIDCLYEAWEWWRSGGGSKNARIAEILDFISFSEWLDGKAGVRFGFTAWRDADHDNLEISRGQFYDPLRYWADHVMAAVSVGMPIVRYDQLVDWNEQTTAQIVAAVQRVPVTTPAAIRERVGLAPTAEQRPNGAALISWSADQLARLRELLTPELLEACGLVSPEPWLPES